jgi:PEGA domain-containing protein
MKSAASILCCVLLVFQGGTASPNTSQQGTTAVQQPVTVPASTRSVLEDGTPVRLRISQTVSSADAHLNDRVEFEVVEEVKVADTIVVPKGGIAWGTVTEAQPKRRMGRGGKLEIVMDSVRLIDGEKAALRATKEAKGGGHVGAMTAGIVATGLLFWPAAPFFLFIHGKDITIPKGTEVPTFVEGNFPLDLAKFQQGPAVGAQIQSGLSQSVPPAQPPTVANAEVEVRSTPDGADILLDDAFVGNTPSTITVSSGDHVIVIKKSGYKPWQKNIKVTTGKITVTAELEPGASSSKAHYNSPTLPGRTSSASRLSPLLRLFRNQLDICENSSTHEAPIC